ncbi:hypothetical protein ACFQH5_15120 [Halomonas salifodinae]|uniref:Uncharacterized protein n=1 Tax=Halomonas salifodinae TaxID=438745 RepID=A0ABW2F1F7_9GAMM
MANPSPTPPPPGRGRKKGSKNALPSPARLREYRRTLREAADAGDVHAAGWLLTVDALERQQAGEGRV